jgi:hypothetical protein
MSQSTSRPSTVSLSLGPDELELVLTALRLLESTLRREQADELKEVKRLLARVEATSSTGPGSAA